MKAIIYTTQTGSTERYAKLLAHETGLPAYTLAEEKSGFARRQRNLSRLDYGGLHKGLCRGGAPLQRLRGMRRRYGANRNTGGQCA